MIIKQTSRNASSYYCLVLGKYVTVNSQGCIYIIQYIAPEVSSVEKCSAATLRNHATCRGNLNTTIFNWMSQVRLSDSIWKPRASFLNFARSLRVIENWECIEYYHNTWDGFLGCVPVVALNLTSTSTPRQAWYLRTQDLDPQDPIWSEFEDS